MTTEKLLLQLVTEVREIKAMLDQLKPRDFTPTLEQEIAAVEAQGGDIFEHFKAKGKELSRTSRKKTKPHNQKEQQS